MSWQSSARSLLHDFSRSKSSKSSTPTDLQLERLYIEAADESEDSERDGVWNNMYPIADMIRGEKGRKATSFMNLILRDAVSSRNRKVHLKNDTYTPGVSAELIMSYPSQNTCTNLPHKPHRSVPFALGVTRDRCRPDPSLTTAELYLILAMAAKHRRLLDVKSIKLRLLIVYSHWVQIVNVATTVSYITSIVDWHADIAGKMIIRRSAWFNFMGPSGQLHVLLSAFEGIELEFEPGLTGDTTTKVLLQERSINASQLSKRLLENGEELDKRNSKSQKVSHEQASRESQDVP
ncbi:uncharacterized protein RAG0_16654 [Rhynchosporium agropyri]|uniref:Uncharacterized protein n=1 Tax=Rhynchosporium agropyri TaxID=914238 RepID=A0A1E1LT62_9HELO|nr:uncharacterized protein RAG0_16654 [Rhynchosporium agropyri]